MGLVVVAYSSLSGKGRGGRLFEVGANSRLGAYSNKYGNLRSGSIFVSL